MPPKLNRAIMDFRYSFQSATSNSSEICRVYTEIILVLITRLYSGLGPEHWPRYIKNGKP